MFKWTILFLLITTFVLYAGLQIGEFNYSTRDIIQCFKDPQSEAFTVVWRLRFTRMATAWLSGGILALSGLVMQSLFRNGLVDPYILGTSSGASLGVSLLVLGYVPTYFSLFSYPLFAFAGAIGITWLALHLSQFKSDTYLNNILLIGIALSSLCNAALAWLTYQSTHTEKLRMIIFWTMGSFEYSNGIYLIFLFFTLLLGSTWTWLEHKSLDVSYLSLQNAQNLGLSIKKFHYQMLMISSFMVAMVVAIAGPIGFVGLMIPHFTRGLVGAPHKKAIPITITLGGTYMMGADVLIRWLYPPVGIPIGIITALIGTPFFVYLQLKKQVFQL
ncbi:MAG: iron ABC transporter permease [Bacteroidia bacterium]|nr:iron ABC transporter permease [Bacteroidia bacterium]MDW8345519.1 iron ABC transporter permease [Bacteroidia bacterium]